MFGFFKENAAVQKMIRTRYQVIFFAESAYYYQYFKHLFEALQERHTRICYITSDRNDPVFQLQDAYTDVIFSRHTLAFAFSRLQADVVIMTMPDLDRYIFKRSPGVKKYVYVFHALVSTHQQYRAHAFDAYDAVFLAGPHHREELQAQEQLYDLPSKELVPYGYPLLEDLEAKSHATTASQSILLAPSWYSEGILQTCLHDIVKLFAGTSTELLIRPHPEFIKRNPRSFRQLQQAAKAHGNIHIDTEPSLWKSMLSCSHLITDRSGIALEYAFVEKRPVIFIDTPLKIQNEKMDEITLEPVENKYRHLLGLCLAPSQLHQLPHAIEETQRRQKEFEASISSVKEKLLYPPAYKQQGIDYILAQLS